MTRTYNIALAAFAAITLTTFLMASATFVPANPVPILSVAA